MKKLKCEIVSSVPSTAPDTKEVSQKGNVTTLEDAEQPASKAKCEGLQKLQQINKYLAVLEEASKTQDSTRDVVEEKNLKTGDEEQEPLLEAEETNKKKKKRVPKAPPENVFWKDTKRADHPMIPIPRPPKTVEIRGGDVVGACECVKRNGLQQDCPKDGCKGHELCMSWPSPRCQPSGLGAPIVIESRVKKPEPANCETTSSDELRIEKAAAEKRRKEEARLVEMARGGWAPGEENAKIQMQTKAEKGFVKCKTHSSAYRLVPLMKSKKTQTQCDDERAEKVTTK